MAKGTLGKRADIPVVEEAPYKEIEETAATQEIKDVVMMSVTNCTALNVRSAPSLKADILATIPVDTIVKAIDAVDGFTKVIIDRGVKGYCMSEFLCEVR